MNFDSLDIKPIIKPIADTVACLDGSLTASEETFLAAAGVLIIVGAIVVLGLVGWGIYSIFR